MNFSLPPVHGNAVVIAATYVECARPIGGSMHRQNIVRDLSYDFARHILQLYKQRAADREFRPLFTQLLRSGTSIASNIEEAIGSQSRADFTHKISIAYKKRARHSIGCGS